MQCHFLCEPITNDCLDLKSRNFHTERLDYSYEYLHGSTMFIDGNILLALMA